jgi:hypothetical protein
MKFRARMGPRLAVRPFLELICPRGVCEHVKNIWDNQNAHSSKEP